MVLIKQNAYSSSDSYGDDKKHERSGDRKDKHVPLTKEAFEADPANYALAFYDIITTNKSAQGAFIASIENDIDSDQFIGKIIKQLRQIQNKSQEELSNQSQVSQAYLSLIENGTRTPKFFTLKQIANGLNVSASLINNLAMLMAQSDESPFADYLINNLFREKEELLT